MYDDSAVSRTRRGKKKTVAIRLIASVAEGANSSEWYARGVRKVGGRMQ